MSQTPKLCIDVESTADYIPKVLELAKAHGLEYGHSFAVEPDIRAYESAFAAGRAFGIHARVGGVSVGHCSVFLTSHMHNRQVLQAACDAYFVRPDKRGGTIPGRIVKAAEGEAKKRGASQFLWICKAGTEIVSAFVRRGYVEQDIVLVKEL